MKDKTFIKSKSPSGEKKSTSSIASIQRPARLQPMSNGRTQSPSFNFGLNSPMPQSQLTDMKTDEGNLVPCQNCGRSFASDRLSKHQSICRKTTGKQRKVFDSSKMRTQGTDAAKYNRAGARRAHDAIKPKSNWRQKHGNNFKYYTHVTNFNILPFCILFGQSHSVLINQFQQGSMYTLMVVNISKQL